MPQLELLLLITIFVFFFFFLDKINYQNCPSAELLKKK